MMDTFCSRRPAKPVPPTDPLSTLPYPPKNRHGVFEEFCPFRELIGVNDMVEFVDGERAFVVVGFAELPATGNKVLLLADGRWMRRSYVKAVHHEACNDGNEPWRVVQRRLAREKPR